MINMLSTLLNAAKIVMGYKGLPRADVKYLIKSAVARGGHGAYEFLLRRYDSKIKFIDKKEVAYKTFVGNGYGEGTLDTYRKIEMQNRTVLFEKIYYRDSMDYKKMCFFYDKVYECLIKQGLSTPYFYSILEGNLFAVVYIPFIELKHIDLDKYEIIAIKIAQKIKNIQLDIIDKGNEFLFDLDCSLMFKNGIDVLYHLTSSNIEIREKFQSVYSYVTKQDRFLQHGDLNPRNIYTNYIIDWDEFGMYPEGYDLGYILSYGQILRGSFVNLQLIDTIIEQFSQTNVVNLIFFVIVFSSKKDLFENQEVLFKCIEKLFFLYENR